MVFSSVPVYLDPPNWQQQPNHLLQHQGVPGGTEIINNNHHHPQLPPLPPHVGGGSSSGSGSIRPGSMADRARLAKIPQPDAALKCPRCESTNTKFCYFNNYSLSQPRHFCKTCRRYWTRGGALRNVPVGGGCRRNKKSKNSSSSKSNSNSTSTGDNHQRQAHTGSDHQIMSHNLPHQTPQLPFMASLQNLTAQFGSVGNLGLNLTGIQAQINGASDQVGLTTSDMLSGPGVHHFPFFDPSGLYPFQSGAAMEASSSSMVVGDQLRPGPRVAQVIPVKMEANHHHHHQLLNLSRPFSGLSSSENKNDDHNTNNNNQYWGGNSWSTPSDLSGLNSSSTTNHLL